MTKTFRLIDTHEESDITFAYDESNMMSCDMIAFFECYDSDDDQAQFKHALDTLAINETATLDEYMTLTRVS